MIADAVFSAQAEAMIPVLHRVCMSILHQRADAQDAVQSALLKAWEKRGSAKPESFRPWLTRIAINECRNIQRRRMRVVPTDSFDEGEQPQDIGLAEAMDALPEKLRTPLLLKYMEGFTEREIGASLGVPLTTVKSRLFRARRALAQALGEEVELR